MNSYFYKFMINLLKRFSSERKLLETRGAFIIRSEHPAKPRRISPSIPRAGWDGDDGVEQPKHRAPSEPKSHLPSLPRSLADGFRANLAFHVSRHHISPSHPRRRCSSLLNSIVRVRFVKKQLDQPEHEDRLWLGVPNRENPSTRPGEMLAWRSLSPQNRVFRILGVGGFCFGFLRSRGWKDEQCGGREAKCRGSWQGIILNAMKCGARDAGSAARWEITGLTVEARWRNQ